MKKVVPVCDAVGLVLCHDITEVIPGEFKGRAFRKGHVVEPSDIPRLLSMGKENLYVLSLQQGVVHEDEAALRIAAAAAGPGVRISEPEEGKVNLSAESGGLLKIRVDALNRINSLPDVVLGTLHTNQHVTSGRAVAATRIIPLIIETERIREVEDICAESFPLVEIKPFKRLKVGLVTTGSEVFHGRIQDGFGPVLRAKFSDLGCEVVGQVLVSDDVSMTVQAIENFLAAGVGMVAVTGGMSVDPDDQTPAAIRKTGAQVVSYGASTFPGAMFMLAYQGMVPIVGLPACVMYHRASIFDLVIPRILAGEILTRADMAALGHGGLCSVCPECRYPFCSFGKGH